MLLNTRSLVTDVNIINELYKESGINLKGDYTDVYKYLRSTIVSLNQARALTGENIDFLSNGIPNTPYFLHSFLHFFFEKFVLYSILFKS